MTLLTSIWSVYTCVGGRSARLVFVSTCVGGRSARLVFVGSGGRNFIIKFLIMAELRNNFECQLMVLNKNETEFLY